MAYYFLYNIRELIIYFILERNYKEGKRIVMQREESLEPLTKQLRGAWNLYKWGFWLHIDTDGSL